MADWFSRWPEAIPLKGTDTETSEETSGLSLDCPFWHSTEHNFYRSSQFTSKLWTATFLGVQLHNIAAYQTVLVEHYYQHVKTALRARLTTPRNWLDEPCHGRGGYMQNTEGENGEPHLNYSGSSCTRSFVSHLINSFCPAIRLSMTSTRKESKMSVQ